MEKDNLDEFSRLVENLNDGTLSLKTMKIAYEEHIRGRADLSDSVKDVLAGKSGLIHRLFMIIDHTVGAVDLVDLRAKQGEFEL